MNGCRKVDHCISGRPSVNVSSDASARTKAQAELNSHHPEAFFPVPNKWGGKGATFVELARVIEKLFRSGLDLAPAHVRK